MSARILIVNLTTSESDDYWHGPETHVLAITTHSHVPLSRQDIHYRLLHVVKRFMPRWESDPDVLKMDDDAPLDWRAFFQNVKDEELIPDGLIWYLDDYLEVWGVDVITLDANERLV